MSIHMLFICESNVDFVFKFCLRFYSNLRIVSILSITAFLFGIVTLFAINPVTSAMVKYYEQTKSEYSKDIDHLVNALNVLWKQCAIARVVA